MEPSALELFATLRGFGAPSLPTDIHVPCQQALGWRYWLSGRELLRANVDRVARVVAALANDDSRRTIARQLAFRMGQCLAYAGYRAPDEQYLNELTLSELLFSLCEGYRFHVRQHQYNSFESVLYAVAR